MDVKEKIEKHQCEERIIKRELDDLRREVGKFILDDITGISTEYVFRRVREYRQKYTVLKAKLAQLETEKGSDANA